MFIITSLFMVVLVLMILAAIVKLVPSTLGSADSFNDDQKALAAAQAGVRYAVAKLQDDFLWRADYNGKTIDLPGFVVTEDEGNVFGYLKTDGGDVSQFRLRFNYQDGDPGQDNRPDPSVFIAHPYVSVNNLTNYVSGTEVPETSLGANFPVPNPLDPRFTLPSRRVVLIVEGLAGDGLRDTTPTALNPPPGTTRRVSRAYVEAIFAQSNELGGDSVLSGGGDINIHLADSKAQLELNTSSGDGQVNVRATSSLNVFGGDSPNVTAKRGKGKGKGGGGSVQGLLTFDGPSSFDEDTSTVNTQTVSNPDLMSLEWSALSLPDTAPASSSAAQINAGIYYWNESSGQMEWYDDVYTDLWSPSTSGPGTVVSSDFAEVRGKSTTGIGWGTGPGNGKNSGPIITVDGDVNVQPVGSNTGVFFVTEDPATVTYEFQFKGSESESHKFYSSGDFYVQGPLQGEGTSVIAGGDLTITNGGVDITANPGAESGVNLYSKGDLTISTNVNGDFKGKGGTQYDDLKMTGLAFTWGDFHAILNDPLTSSKAGKLEITGALAAFGGDPATQNPGENGKGNISIWAKDSKLKYDPAFTNAITGATSGELTKVLWTTY